MPVWIPRDLSEIKPGSFSQSSKYPKHQTSQAETDPNYRFIKRLVTPRERDKELEVLMTGCDYIPKYKKRVPELDCSDTGSALIQSLPEKEMANAKAGDIKAALRRVAQENSQEMRSGMRPAAAYKVYAWRDILDDREEKSKRYACQPQPSSNFLPDETNQLVSIYHRDLKDRGGVYHLNGYWQIPRVGPSVYRDKWGLKIIDNLEPERPEINKTSTKEDGYYYQWPLVDSDTGHSIQVCCRSKY